MIQPMMEVTKEQIINGSVLENGATVTNQFFVYINDTVTISIVYWLGRVRAWGMTEYDIKDNQYEIGLVVDNNSFIMNKLTEGIKFEIDCDDDHISTYPYLSIEDVNEFIRQVCIILGELDEKGNGS